MNIEKIVCGKSCAATVSGDDFLIADAESLLDLLMMAKYEAGTKNLVLDKRQLAEEFFVLSSGLAGEILQKIVTYGGKIAVYGDFSSYNSKPLNDFIYESNKGNDVFFARTKEEAIQRISRS